MRDTDIAWAAGLFEGEGCVYASKSNGAYQYPRLTMSLTDEDVLRRFVVVVGGRIRGPYVNKKHPNRKPLFHWALAGSGVVPVAKSLWPHLGKRRRERIVEVFGVGVVDEDF